LTAPDALVVVTFPADGGLIVSVAALAVPVPEVLQYANAVPAVTAMMLTPAATTTVARRPMR
jgi:hypothetical protein